MAKIQTNFASAHSLDELKAQLQDAFRIVENLLSANNTLYARRTKTESFPSGDQVIKGDVTIDFTTTVPGIFAWDGKNWIATAGGSDGGQKGDKGDKGDKGNKGDKGDKGDAGDASTVPGPKGDKGDKGDPGTGGSGGELIVADGVDNPPELVYNDIDGGDYLYAD